MKLAEAKPRLTNLCRNILFCYIIYFQMVKCILRKKKTWYTLSKMALNFQLQFLTSRKRFGGVKTIARLERARKNLSIYVFYFFLRESAYDYERVKYSVKKMCRAILLARFSWQTLPLCIRICAIPVARDTASARAGRQRVGKRQLDSVNSAALTLPLLVLAGKEWGNVSSTRSTPQRLHYIRTPSLTGAELVEAVDIWSGHFDI